jgi:trans-aconitate methyltransferase
LAGYPITPAIRKRKNVPDLSRRTQPADLPELMDQPCTRAELRACLKDLAWLNRTLLGYRPTLQWLEGVRTRNTPGLGSETWDGKNLSPIRILDIGCGYGDSLRRIERWAHSKKVSFELTGLDLNPDAIAIAAEASQPRSRIRWVNGNVFAYTPSQPPHLVLSALFTHHLSDEEVIRFVQWMENNAVAGWFINDLSRNIVPYRLISWLSRLIRLHPFVQNDGSVSFARAFVAEDWQHYCTAAGLSPSDVAIQGFTPGRLCVSRRKS